MLRPILIVLATLSGCAATSAPDGLSGLCAGLEPLAGDHAAGLLQDGGDVSVVTGERLLAGIDAGCAR